MIINKLCPKLISFCFVLMVLISFSGCKKQEASLPNMTKSISQRQGGETYFVDRSATVYISAGDTLYNLYPRIGAFLWKKSYYLNGTTPTAFGNRLYVGSKYGIYAISRSGGLELWLYPTGSPVSASPIIYNDWLWTASEDGKVHAIDANTGELRWTFQTAEHKPITASPTFYAGIASLLYVASTEGTLYCINAATGTEIWHHNSLGKIYAGPTSSLPGYMYVLSADGNLYSIDPASGAEISKKDFKSNGYSSPTVVDDVLYAYGDNGISAIDIATQKTLWSNKMVNSILSSPIVSDGVLYIGGKTHLYAFDIKTGVKKWESSAIIDAYSASPVVYDGAVYTVGFDMERNSDAIIAIDVRTGATITKFPISKKYVGSSPLVMNGDGKVYHSGVSGEKQ